MEKHNVKRMLMLHAAVASALTFAACSNGSNDTTTIPPGSAQARLVNAVFDSSPIDAVIANSPVTASNVGFGTDSGFFIVPDAIYQVELKSTDGSAQIDTIVNNVEVSDSSQTTLYAVGTVGDSNVTGLSVEMPVINIPDGKASVEFVNASSSAIHMEVFVVPTGSPLVPGTEITTIEGALAMDGDHPNFSGPFLVDAGSYRLVLLNAHAAPGTNAQVFDSGSDPAVALNSGSSAQFAVLEAPGAPNGAPFYLLRLDNNGGATRIVVNHPAS
jgi:hypothetical protein